MTFSFTCACSRLRRSSYIFLVWDRRFAPVPHYAFYPWRPTASARLYTLLCQKGASRRSHTTPSISGGPPQAPAYIRCCVRKALRAGPTLRLLSLAAPRKRPPYICCCVRKTLRVFLTQQHIFLARRSRAMVKTAGTSRYLTRRKRY